MFVKLFAATALIVTPVAASAAPVNSAASLSVAKSVRASAPTGATQKAAGGGNVVAIVLGALLLGAGVFAIVDGSEDSDSN